MKKVYLIIIVILLFSFTTRADWVPVNNGLNVLSVNAVTAYNNEGVDYLFAGTNRGAPNSGVLFRSTNNGLNWTIALNVPNDVLSLATTTNNNVSYLFVGTGNGIGYTSNNGINWNSAGGPSFPGWTVSLAASGNYVFAGTYRYADTGGVYKSTNYGLNWYRLNYFPQIPLGFKYYVGMNGNNVYSSSTYNSGIFVSTDLGISWTQSSPSIYMNSFTFNNNYIFVGGGSGISAPIYKSSDNGYNWNPTTITNVAIYALAVYNNIVFAGGYGGVGFWVSHDNGTTWLERGVNQGLNGSPRSICISNGYVFAGTDGNGVFRRPLGELIGIYAKSDYIPNEYQLGDNYPNPFNPETKIRFNVINEVSKVRSKVKLNVYNSLGQIIETLVNDEMAAGEYEITWNATNLTSGVYYYTLSVNDFKKTKKAILLK